jgi:hypothetical protein
VAILGELPIGELPLTTFRLFGRRAWPRAGLPGLALQIFDESLREKRPKLKHSVLGNPRQVPRGDFLPFEDQRAITIELERIAGVVRNPCRTVLDVVDVNPVDESLHVGKSR